MGRSLRLDHDGRLKATFLHIDELLSYSREFDVPKRGLFDEWKPMDLSTAALAMIVTLTFCGVVVVKLTSDSAVAMPTELCTAFTVILGFYFGSKVGKPASGDGGVEERSAQRPVPKVRKVAP